MAAKKQIRHWLTIKNKETFAFSIFIILFDYLLTDNTAAYLYTHFIILADGIKTAPKWAS